MIGSGRQCRVWALFLLLIELAASSAHAAILRIADGDCAALTAAATSPPGSEPALIVLAAGGHYGPCEFIVTGKISIDGAGATIALYSGNDGPAGHLGQFQVKAGGRLTVRGVNLEGSISAPPVHGAEPVLAAIPVFRSSGEMVLDSVSIRGTVWAQTGNSDAPMILTDSGSLALRNVTIVGNAGSNAMLNSAGGVIDVAQSTLIRQQPAGVLFLDYGGSITVANSILLNEADPICYRGLFPAKPLPSVSKGGNVVSDDTCGFASSADRVVRDLRIGTFGDNGGVAHTVLLSGDSPAVGNGLATNCEATDARGVVRNVAARGACDAGAYEFGGGRGLLAQGGMNGFFYDAAADGHYVTVQRLDWGSALVIWNTFDRDGNAAWIYAIGMVDGRHIHAGAAQNVGGRLQAGGAPTGSHGIVWGTIDIDFGNCFDATFRYDSPLPNFGSGQFPLDRLAFLGDLDCSD
jgi:hypothetical protein